MVDSSIRWLRFIEMGRLRFLFMIQQLPKCGESKKIREEVNCPMSKCKTTSPKVASTASKVLKSVSTGKAAKSVAGSALAQTKAKKKK
ncbi:MAG: hypothetical protein Q7T53_10940 [Deltaproteobacteria bacterium]|nr:hypothetical protein [Deltaproteobacteria bacterium]